MSENLVIADDGNVDIVGKRRDGGVDLVVVVSGFLGSSESEQAILRSKLQSYLDAVYSEEFQLEFGTPSLERTRVLISCAVPPAEEIAVLVEQLSPYFREQAVSLQLAVQG